MTLVLQIPDTWQRLLGLDTGDAAERAREMLVIERYREGRISRGQLSEMLNLDFHSTERLLKDHDAEQQASWEEMEDSFEAARQLMRS
jgi:predicted HTH domain antitoxin